MVGPHPGHLATRRLLFVAVLATVAAAGTPARAQINTEAMRPSKPKDGVHGWLKGGLSWLTGNSNYFATGWEGKLAYHHGVHTPFVQVALAYAVASDVRYQSSGFAHLRWPAMWHRRVGSELFTQIEYNEFTSMALRTLVGTGVRVAAVLHEKFQLFLGTGYMFEYEKVTGVADDDPHPDVTKYHRWTSYVSFRVFVNKWLVIANTTYLQPRFRDFGDYRFLESLSLVFKIYKALKLEQFVTVSHDSKPPRHIYAWDTAMLTKLAVEF